MLYQKVDAALRREGLFCRGGFYPVSGDQVPIEGKTCIMVGNSGKHFWANFMKSQLKLENPLDSWVQVTLSRIAKTFGAQVLFPFTGPPYFPFVDWARKSEEVFISPTGLLIHPKFGLWHAYRGLFVFNELIPLPKFGRNSVNPCSQCVDKPCKNVCPVDAITPDTFKSDLCADHIAKSAGSDCAENGCLARRACPIGVNYQYPKEQATFHMASFLKMIKHARDLI